MEFTWWTVVIIGAALAAGIGSRFVFKSTDNIVEETSEKIIKDKTNFDVDLSPDTPDPDHK